MNAKMGNSPSFVWLSLLEGRKVLEAGCLWCVGDGHKISIYQHKWLKGVPGGKPTGNGNQDYNLTWVEDLIDNDSRCWNSELILETFCNLEA